MFISLELGIKKKHSKTGRNSRRKKTYRQTIHKAWNSLEKINVSLGGMGTLDCKKILVPKEF